MSDLVTWLRAQMDADVQRIAPGPEPGDWCDRADGLHLDARRATQLVDAMRKIVDLHSPEPGQHPDFCGHDLRELPCPTLRASASMYADRDGYNPEWAPE